MYSSLSLIKQHRHNTYKPCKKPSAVGNAIGVTNIGIEWERGTGYEVKEYSVIELPHF